MSDLREHGGTPTLALVLILVLVLAGCAGTIPSPSGDSRGTPELTPDSIRVADGDHLPLHRWGPEDPERVVLALHGFNDHGGSMQALGEALAADAIAVYAYDQRGFGATRNAGYWSGHRLMAADARTVLRLLDARYPEQTPFLVGKSMGGGVALLAAATHADDETPAPVAGTVLIAPAVWSRGDMPWYQRFGLWLGARLAPGWRLDGELVADLEIHPTDDPEVLQQMRADPLVLHDARIDALDGLTTLMTHALEAAPNLPAPTLTLYGDRDDLVPPGPLTRLLETLADSDDPGHRAVLYPEGYHMLTRYTRARTTFDDIVAWLHHPQDPLPSGHDGTAGALAATLAERWGDTDDAGPRPAASVP
ncbi:alpha/beta fold hydrolase [Thioalkalivibrio sp. ALJT]|uniref:alpha/beta fold hydrolase n=1 Tax=Thioalkalivibrio sp. ALJT TaxID=1158146 RepID=UPI000375A2E7|nr:alpha/beta fold hydrolase [Thioalkalivibrio sp. ALJT]